MTYIESVLADFIKSILTRGIKTLKSERFFPYSVVLLIIVLTGTIATFIAQLVPVVDISEQFVSILLYVELSAAISFVSIGLFLGRSPAKVQIPLLISIIIAITVILAYDIFNISNTTLLIIVAIYYVVWIAITTFSTFSLFRDLFGSNIFGTILFLGKQEDDGRAMFSFVGWILAFLNFGLGYLVYQNSGGSKPIIFTSIVIMVTAFIAILPLFGFQKKNDVFFSILNGFYMFSTIRVIMFVFRVLTTTSSSESSLGDTLFSMFIALYAIQGAAAKGIKLGSKVEELTLEEQLLEEAGQLGLSNAIARLITDRGIVMVILGILLGYHAMQVQASFGRKNIFSDIELFAGSDISLLGYEISLIVTLFIILMSMLSFILIPGFRSYANPEVKRIPWAPDYADLKIMLAGIKSGDISWKADAAKLAMGMAKDKLREKLGMAPKTDENRISNTFNKWLSRSKK